MTDATRYGLWLTFRVGKRLQASEAVLTASMLGKKVTIKSEREGQPLSESFWLVASCTGFDSETEAKAFGEELRRAMHLAGLGARVGVDAGDPGEDRTRSWINPDILEPVGDTHPDLRLAPDVHGLVVLPDDGNNLFARARASGEVRGEYRQLRGSAAAGAIVARWEWRRRRATNPEGDPDVEPRGGE